MRKNELGQTIGFAIDRFVPPSRPQFSGLSGKYVRLEAITSAQLPALYEAFSHDVRGANWTYMPYGPFTGFKEFSDWVHETCFGEDPKFYTIYQNDKPAGVASFLRIEPKIGCIEIGHIHLSPLLQRTREGTEALMLMMEWAFSAGYRRLEWKCDALNAPSCHAAKRLGFSFEGLFRRATMYKSRNRDTAWYAIIAEDWTALHGTYQLWLNSDNFDSNGREIQKLSELTSSILLQGKP